MEYDFIPPFIDNDITLTVCRIAGSEKGPFVDYEANLPNGSIQRLSITNDSNSDIEQANALLEAANLFVYMVNAKRMAALLNAIPKK